MNEKLLYSIWKFRLWGLTPLYTTDGQPVEIIHPGFRNHHSGPDFFNAQLKMDNTLWIGNVELHVQSKDWILHEHQYDKAYDSVILHVVYEPEDVPIRRSNKSLIPTLALKDFLPPKLIDNYRLLTLPNSEGLACGTALKTIEPILTHSWLERMALERLEGKYEQIKQLLQYNTFDWEESFYQFMARSFGAGLNAIPFEMLAQSLPNRLLARHKDHLLQLEALFYGQAGFLDSQHLVLAEEYAFLAGKYRLKPLEKHLWKFHRTRPGNFPDRRLAQFIALVHQSDRLFSRILAARDLKEIYTLLDIPEYYSRYFCCNIHSPGKESMNTLLINSVAVFLFAYGKYSDAPMIMDRALELLQQLPAENNVVTKLYKSNGMELSTAMESQAVLQLKHCYCAEKRCLDCAIGNKVLTMTGSE